jgi:hypothetical protein
MDIVPSPPSGIGRAEALFLLASVPFGRIVFTERALPAIRLVNHLVEDGDLIVRNDHDSAIVAGDGAAARGTVVAYEADDVDPVTCVGWSVTVTGTATLITHSAVVARYQRALRPSAVTGQLIRVHAGIVAGHRFGPRPGSRPEASWLA